MSGTDLFISYARDDDEPFVKRLHGDLRQAGVRVWWDREAMDSRGRTFLQEIRDGIASSERLLLVVGPRAVESDYVRAEWRFALEACKPVVSVLRAGRKENASAAEAKQDFQLVPKELRRFHCTDFRVARAYDEALAELLRILRASLPPLAPLHGVDALPAHYLMRGAALERLGDGVLPDLDAPTVVDAHRQASALVGMGGSGKSVLAAAFARACDTRRSFEHGIVWLRVGREPSARENLRTVAAALGRAHADPGTQTTADALAALLADRNCLLVLDDVWSVADAEPYRNALVSTRSRLLLTTRDAGVAAALGAVVVAVDVLDETDALLLLARWSGQEAGGLPEAARAVAAECGLLPLALSMVGAMARGRADRWQSILTRLRNADLEKIRRDFPNYPHPDLLRAIGVSVEALEPALRARYLDFAVFPDKAAVPEATLATFWASEGLDTLDTEDAVAALCDRSLLRRGADGTLTLHDLQADYVRRSAPDIGTLHERLLGAYAAACPGGWSSGPNDGYFFEHLVHHLRAAGRHAQAHALLTSSPDWLDAKLAATGSDASYVADLERIISAYADPVAAEQLVELGALHAAARAVGDRAALYDDAGLDALVARGQARAAQAYARLRGSAPDRFRGMLTVHRAMRTRAQAEEAFLTELERTGAALIDERARNRAMGELVAERIAAAQWDEARTLVIGMSDPAAQSATWMRIALAQAGASPVAADELFALAAEAAGSVRDVEERVAAKAALAGALITCGRLSRALEVAAHIEIADRRARTLCEVAIAALRAVSDTAPAAFDRCAESLQGTSRNAVGAELAIDLAARLAAMGFASHADQVFDLARTAAMKIAWDDYYSDQMDVASVAAVIVPDEPYKTAQVDMLCRLAEALWRSGRVDAALAAVESAESTAQPIQDEAEAGRAAALIAKVRAVLDGQPMAPSAGDGTASHMDGASADAALSAEWTDLSGAETSIMDLESSRVPERGDGARALRRIASGLVRCGYSAEALALARQSTGADRVIALAEWLASGSSTTDEAPASILDELTSALRALPTRERFPLAPIVVDILVRAGRQEHAGRVIARAAASAREDVARFEMDPLLELIAPLCSAADGTTLDRVADDLIEAGRLADDELFLRRLSRTLADCGQFALAARAARAIESEYSRSEAVHGVAYRMADANLLEEATHLVQEDDVDTPVHVLHALTKNAALAEAREGRIDDALSTIAYVPAADEDWGRSRIAEALIDSGRLHEAGEVIAAIAEPATRARQQCRLAAGLARTGDLDASAELIEDVRRIEAGYTPISEALLSFAEALARAGRPDDARAEALNISYDGDRARAQAALLPAFVHAGRGEEARTLFADALALAKAQSDTLDNVVKLDLLGDIAESAARGGLIAETLQAADLLADFARADESSYTESPSVRAVSASYLREAAERALGHRDRALKVLLETLLGGKRFDDALAVAGRLGDEHRAAGARQQVAGACVADGRFAFALMALGAQRTEEFLGALGDWAPYVEPRHPRRVLDVLAEAARIVGWARPEWDRLSRLLSPRPLDVQAPVVQSFVAPPSA